MTLPRRPRPLPHEKQATVNDAMVPGAFRGRLPVVAPVTPRQRMDARSRGITAVSNPSGRSSRIDQFALTASGAQDLALTYQPIVESWNLELNGIKAKNGTDYSIGGQTLSLLAAMDARSGDVVQVQYDYLTGTPTTPTDALGPYPSAVLADSPLVYYRMDGTGSTESDLSGHARHGTISGTPTRSRPSMLTNDTNSSTDFGAGNQRPGATASAGAVVSCPYDAGLITSSWTAEFWTNKGNSSATAFLQWDGRLRCVLGTGGLGVYFYTDAVTYVNVATSTGFLTATDYNAKHMVAVVYDAAAQTITYYHDGSQLGATVTGVTTAMRGTTTALQFGWHDGNDGLCDGDEFAFYGSALPAAAIASHWNAR